MGVAWFFWLLLVSAGVHKHLELVWLFQWSPPVIKVYFSQRVTVCSTRQTIKRVRPWTETQSLYVFWGDHKDTWLEGSICKMAWTFLFPLCLYCPGLRLEDPRWRHFLRFRKCVSFIFKFVGLVFQLLSYDHIKLFESFYKGFVWFILSNPSLLVKRPVHQNYSYILYTVMYNDSQPGGWAPPKVHIRWIMGEKKDRNKPDFVRLTVFHLLDLFLIFVFFSFWLIVSLWASNSRDV